MSDQERTPSDDIAHDSEQQARLAEARAAAAAVGAGEEPWERLVLSERDYAILLDGIENPKPPSAALRRAMRDYEALRKAYPDNNL